MLFKCLLMASVLSLTLLLYTCNKKLPPGSVKEFSFAGNHFKDGKVTVSPEFEVKQDPKTKKVSFRKAGGLGLEFDCSCSAGGGGSCFPVVQESPGTPTILLCGSIDPCTSCDEVITNPGIFTFRATVRARN